MDSNFTGWHCTPPTTTDFIPWQPAPNFRSTSNILTSCLTTLFVCVWSALHEDISTGRTRWRRYLSKFGWVFVGLFCPELLFWIAFNQFKMALHLTIKARRLLPVSHDVEGATGALPRSYRILSKVLGMSHYDHAPHFRPVWVQPELWRDNWSQREGTWFAKMWMRAMSFCIPQSMRAGSTSWTDYESIRADREWMDYESSLAAPSASPVPPTSPLEARNEPVCRQHRWTLAHGFYAAMGGFVLKDPHVPRSPDHYLPAWQKNGVLTPAGVCFLMEHEPHLIPDLAYEDIVSFGKADAIAKVLLILQVSWFLVTCIIRHAQGLPLCLLEITTFAHASCTLLTYFAWWAKPKGVAHQTTISDPEIGAFMSMASPATRFMFGGFLSLDFDSELPYNLGTPSGLECRDGRVSLHRGRSRAGGLRMKFMFGETKVPWYWRKDSSQSLDEKNATRKRWMFAYRAIQKPNMHWCSTTIRYVTPTASLQMYTDDFGPVDPWATTIRPSTHLLAITLLVGAVYGLPHLVGFTVVFTSAPERVLWLVATVLVATMGVGLYVLLWVIGVPYLHAGVQTDPSSSFHRWWRALRHCLQIVISVLYVCSSGYLVVESIRQLFALPPATFDLPSWSRYWPHFS